MCPPTLLYAIDTTYTGPYIVPQFFDQLGMTQIQLVSMAIVNNGLSSVESHMFQVIENRGPESKDLIFKPL